MCRIDRGGTMRIGRTSGIGSGFGVDRRGLGRHVEPIGAAPRPGRDPRQESDGRALIAVEPPPAREPVADRLVRLRAHAPFVVQLIALLDDLPETRRLRRAEPRRAARAYEAAMDGPGLLVPGYLVDVAR
jgi:hypothetical protein